MWYVAHLLNTSYFLAIKDKLKWSQKIVNLTKNDITWYDRAYDGIEIVFDCGDFPNVPLIGTKGYINYNPTSALR